MITTARFCLERQAGEAWILAISSPSVLSPRRIRPRTSRLSQSLGMPGPLAPCMSLHRLGVITFDEDDGEDRAVPLPGLRGGRIPTVVITNHGGRKPPDATLYSHYSLLRTVEDALGVGEHLRHAADASTRPMTPLFAVGGGKAGG